MDTVRTATLCGRRSSKKKKEEAAVVFRLISSSHATSRSLHAGHDHNALTVDQVGLRFKYRVVEVGVQELTSFSDLLQF